MNALMAACKMGTTQRRINGGGDRFWSANACPRCCAVPELKYAISRSSRNPGRPYYECGNYGQFLMWASARSNLPKDKEVGGQGRGTKCNEEAIGEEKQSTTLQMWNEMKELRMANTVEQGRI